MAGADYRHCDLCGSKAFYDADLNYEQGKNWKGEPIPKDQIARVAGKSWDWGYKVDYLGDWAVLCRECALTHKTVIVPIETEQA